MKNQDVIFLKHEADAWYTRNAQALLPETRGDDPVFTLLRSIKPHPKVVIDVGAANGWRLERLRRAHPNARYMGVEPSAVAVRAGKKLFPKLLLKRGVAAHLPMPDASCDLVMVVFTFHWVARENLLRSIAEVDRVLKDGGYLLVSDFLPAVPRKNIYPRRGVFTYKADYGALFEACGNYTTVKRLHTRTRPTKERRAADDFRAATTLYRKQVGAGYTAENK